MNAFISSQTEGAVTTITLARSADHNRLSNAMAGALSAALDAAAASRVIVLRADGADFCLGRDMQPPAPGSAVSAQDVLRDDAAPMIAMYAAFARCRQPLVARVQGRAWGIGAVLAAVCDVTLATSDASFRLRELERGIPPCVAMAPLLDRMPTKALGYLVFAAAELDAAGAQAAGLVSRCIAPDALDAELQQLLIQLLSYPDDALRAVKQYLVSAPRNQAEPALLYGASLLANVLASR
ncbi:MAG: enoyl-CoA hydratase/isomerase family protein [Rubrivivax sp.]|nr:enoyl-CoA hydratase/isomerase family protein [Rubrivivax sp.]